METAFIFIIVGAAAAYLVRKFYRSLKKTSSGSCGCGCTSCPQEQNCEEAPAKAIQQINRLERTDRHPA